jgi:succinylarginine dihydrolase
MREYNFDGIVGNTHNYGGLSPGNVASMSHQGMASSPRGAALEGLAKMRFVHDLGVGQAVLPPQLRPDPVTLRRLGFHAATDAEVVERAAREGEHWLRLCSSASAMWTANAATVAPSPDTEDRRCHFTVANLTTMFHRAIEPDATATVLARIFSDPARFAVHPPLPGGGQLSDEGAANHTRLWAPGRDAVHMFAWGRRAWGDAPATRRYPARQTLEASQAVARLGRLRVPALFPQQDPRGIDDGAFHTDVLAVGSGAFLMLHERAFLDAPALLGSLRRHLADTFRSIVASEDELPAPDAVHAYPFNSQLLTLPGGEMVLLAPSECLEHGTVVRFFARLVAEDNPVTAVHYRDVRQSMNNGGGPACLRLRVALTDEEAATLGGNVMFSPNLHATLAAWVEKHYRDRLTAADLADPALLRESMTALDELSRILGLGNVYTFQR